MVKKIELTQNQFALVDDEYYEWLNQWKWHAIKTRRKSYYVRRVSPIKDEYPFIWMHRLIMDPPKDMQIDHIDGNGLNNCRSNLKVVTPRENSQNLHIPIRSRYPGVILDDRTGRWVAQIKIIRKKNYLGTFDNEKEAAKAYDWACNEIKKGNEISTLSLPKTSKYKGVSWHKNLQKWRAYIFLNGKQKHLGLFEDEEEAHLTYKNAKNHQL